MRSFPSNKYCIEKDKVIDSDIYLFGTTNYSILKATR